MTELQNFLRFRPKGCLFTCLHHGCTGQKNNYVTLTMSTKKKLDIYKKVYRKFGEQQQQRKSVETQLQSSSLDI